MRLIKPLFIIALLFLSNGFGCKAQETVAAQQSKTSKIENLKNKLLSNKRDTDSEDKIGILQDSIMQLQSALADSRERIKVDQHLIDSLKEETNRLNQIVDNKIIETFQLKTKDHLQSNGFFCRVIISSPLSNYYDSAIVQYHLSLAHSIGYDNPENEFYYIYEVYADLLKNYGKYNEEIKSIVNKVIIKFKVLKGSKPDREILKEQIESELKHTEYFKVRNTGKYRDYRHILYLDEQIEKLRNAVEKDNTFTQKEFEKILQQL